MKEVGKTKDSGYQAGVRKTFDISHHDLWNFMFSEKGLHIWLGKISPDKLEINQPHSLANKNSFTITTFVPQSHLRMKWKKANWTNESILQLRFISNNKNSTISFHQEKLQDNNQRNEIIAHWKNILLELEQVLKKRFA